MRLSSVVEVLLLMAQPGALFGTRKRPIGPSSAPYREGGTRAGWLCAADVPQRRRFFSPLLSNENPRQFLCAQVADRAT